MVKDLTNEEIDKLNFQQAVSLLANKLYEYGMLDVDYFREVENESQ